MLYMVLIKKWSLGLAESEADEIRENAGQLGYDAWKMKQIDAERQATMEKLNNIEQSGHPVWKRSGKL